MNNKTNNSLSKNIQQILNNLKTFLERNTPLGILAQKRRQKRGKSRPTKVRIEEKGDPSLTIPNYQDPTMTHYFIKKFYHYTYRIDYIIIWGHGLKHKDEIIDMIRTHPNFKIIKFLYHHPKSIRKLVKAVYSYDYAPLNHLKSKTKYLKHTPKEVLFIFFENHNPNEDYFGKGIFRHYESSTLKSLKEEIRNKFNDRIDGLRTENHVIHASDNTLQTHYILQYLGFDGLQYLTTKSSLIDVPYYVKVDTDFVIKNVPADSLVCNIATGESANPKKRKRIPVKQSPHCEALTKCSHIYISYINDYFKTSDYSWEKYMAMAKNFKYLAHPYSRCYIVTHQLNDGRFSIIDGLHRASILIHQGLFKIPVAVLR